MQSAEDLKGKLEELDTGTQEASGAASGFRSQWEDVKSSVKGVFAVSAGQLVAQGISKGTAALKAMAAESVGLASDLEEVQNVIDVTFGDDAQKINVWAVNAKRSIGMSELEAKRYVGTMGAMLKSSGMTGDAVTDLSMQMVNLAGDMASFYNLDFETAFTKIRSGIAGETEPLKQLGINLSVANMEAYRLAEGIEQAYDKMSPSQQLQLRMAYLAETTKDASGDFERTSDSYANARRLLETNLDTIRADVGEFLLPAVTDVINALNALFEGDNSIAARLEDIESAFKLEEFNTTFDALTAESFISELEELEQKTELTEAEQRRWMYLLRGLSEVIPDTASLIDLQTGTIEGGTRALRENTKAWEENRRAQAMQSKLYSLQAEQSTAYDALVENEYGRIVAENKQHAALQEVQRLAAQFAQETGKAWDGTVDAAWTLWEQSSLFFSGETRAALGDALNAYQYQTGMISQANEAWQGLKDNYDLATQAVEEHEAAVASITQKLEEEASTVAAAAFSVEDYAAAFEGVSAALEAVEEQRAQVEEAMRKQVYNDKLLGGFQQLANPEEELDLSAFTGALERQIDFAEAYRQNLAALRENDTMSADLLNYFASNINADNALLINALAEDPMGEEQQRLIALWELRNEQNDALVEEASAIQLEFDETYQAALATSEEMLSIWEGQQEAYEQAMASNMAGMQGEIEAALPDFQAQASSIRSALAKAFDLSGVTVRWPGLSGFMGGGAKVDGSHATGLDYVPYDGYVAQLHEGERVLTKLENVQLSRGGIGGGMNVDLSALTQAVTAAVREGLAGTGVYMDGASVGHMVADTVSQDIADAAWAGRYGQ